MSMPFLTVDMPVQRDPVPRIVATFAEIFNAGDTFVELRVGFGPTATCFPIF